MDAERLRLYAKLLAMPGRGSLEVLRELSSSNNWLQKAVSELSETPLERWQGEYTRLFVSGYPKTVCPPFESSYINGMMLGPAADELAELYRRAGLQVIDMPADYLGTQLECVAYLLESESEQSAKYLDELINMHLTRWLNSFARDLADNSRMILYQALAQQFLSLDFAQQEVVNE